MSTSDSLYFFFFSSYNIVILLLGDNKMIVYHVVTERPMEAGQKIIFNETNRSGVYTRVHEKSGIIQEIYAHPENYDADTLEHHTSVAMRELALEEVRLKEYPHYPSRMTSLYVSKTYEEAVKWGEFFTRIGRPTFSIVELEINGSQFVGNANRCFRASLDKEENLKMADYYWSYDPSQATDDDVLELLVSGEITVKKIVKEINANLVTGV